MSVQALGRAAAPAPELRSASLNAHLSSSSSSFAAHVAIGGGPGPSPRHAATRRRRASRAQELPSASRHVPSSRASSRESRLRNLIARAEAQRTDAKAAKDSSSETSSPSSPPDAAAQPSASSDAAESLPETSNTDASELTTDRPPAQAQGQIQGSQKLSLEDVNPVGLGRRSRQFLDDVWRRLLDLGQLARPLPVDEDEEEALIQGPNCEFAIPAAQFTKVLVVGPTGRVGRVIVRKLLLRGYSVRVSQPASCLSEQRHYFRTPIHRP